jgi:hypothetical protein
MNVVGSEKRVRRALVVTALGGVLSVLSCMMFPGCEEKSQAVVENAAQSDAIQGEDASVPDGGKETRGLMAETPRARGTLSATALCRSARAPLSAVTLPGAPVSQKRCYVNFRGGARRGAS